MLSRLFRMKQRVPSDEEVDLLFEQVLGELCQQPKAEDAWEQLRSRILLSVSARGDQSRETLSGSGKCGRSSPLSLLWAEAIRPLALSRMMI